MSAPPLVSVPAASSSRVRHRVLAMLFVTVVLNYLDRSNLSVAATELTRELQLDPVRMGMVFSAFGWAYALLQIPGGWLVDRVPPRVLYAVICALWSLATFGQSLVGTVGQLIVLRVLLGIFEAPTFPTCNRLVTTWFPQRERAGAIGCYTSGQFVGLAFLTPALIFMQQRWGWRSVFVVTGSFGVAWALFWWLRYREPRESQASGAEIEHIRRGGGTVDLPSAGAGSRFNWADAKFVLTSRNLWGIYLGQYALNATPWFFLTWFPTYLVKYRHLDFMRAGALSGLPFVGAFLGVLASGFFSDGLIRRGVAPLRARKIPIVAGLLLSMTIVGANYVDQPRWIVLFLAVAFFGNGFSSITWSFVSLVAPPRLLGLTGGVFNFFGNLASITVPLAIGYLARDGRFEPALLFIAGVTLLGALAYVWLVDAKPPAATLPSGGTA